MADQDARIRELEERVAQLETRLTELEEGVLGSLGSAEQVFSDIGRATAQGGRRAAKAAEGLLNRGLDAVRRNLRTDEADADDDDK